MDKGTPGPSFSVRVRQRACRLTSCLAFDGRDPLSRPIRHCGRRSGRDLPVSGGGSRPDLVGHSTTRFREDTDHVLDPEVYVLG